MHATQNSQCAALFQELTKGLLGLPAEWDPLRALSSCAALAGCFFHCKIIIGYSVISPNTKSAFNNSLLFLQLNKTRKNSALIAKVVCVLPSTLLLGLVKSNESARWNLVPTSSFIPPSTFYSSLIRPWLFFTFVVYGELPPFIYLPFHIRSWMLSAPPTPSLIFNN